MDEGKGKSRVVGERGKGKWNRAGERGGYLSNGCFKGHYGRGLREWAVKGMGQGENNMGGCYGVRDGRERGKGEGK